MHGGSHINMANSWLGPIRPIHEHVIRARAPCGPTARNRTSFRRNSQGETRAGAMVDISATWRHLALPYDWRKYSSPKSLVD